MNAWEEMSESVMDEWKFYEESCFLWAFVWIMNVKDKMGCNEKMDKTVRIKIWNGKFTRTGPISRIGPTSAYKI